MRKSFSFGEIVSVGLLLASEGNFWRDSGERHVHNYRVPQTTGLLILAAMLKVN